MAGFQRLRQMWGGRADEGDRSAANGARMLILTPVKDASGHLTGTPPRAGTFTLRLDVTRLMSSLARTGGRRVYSGRPTPP